MARATGTGDPNHSLRQHLIDLLDGGNAHAKFDGVIKNLAPKLRGRSRINFRTRRGCCWNIYALRSGTFWNSAREKHVSPKWPEGYSPKNAAPADSAAWNKSVRQVRRDLKAMQKLVGDPKTDLFARIPWGNGQTILREALLVADHSAYHLGQLLDVRRLLGDWE